MLKNSTRKRGEEHIKRRRRNHGCGHFSEKQFFMEDNDIVIQAVVIIIDGLVYPSIFPNYVAFQYRDDELKRMELLKAELETYEPDEPF